MTKLNIKLNRKTRRVEIMPQPASNEGILYGVFGAVGNPCALEFYNAGRDMKKKYEKVIRIFTGCHWNTENLFKEVK